MSRTGHDRVGATHVVAPMSPSPIPPPITKGDVKSHSSVQSPTIIIATHVSSPARIV